MTIQAGSKIEASDFVGTPSGAADSGKVAKLDAEGKIDNDFLHISSTTADRMLPKPEVITSGLSSVQMNSNTTAFVGIIDVPYQIEANTVFIKKNTIGTSGNFKFALFTTDGQTKIMEETFATGSSTGVGLYQLTTDVTIAPGKYYVMICTTSTTDFNPSFFTTVSAGTLGSNSLYADGGSALPFEGTLTISAGTIPSTFSPLNISATANRTLAVRFANLSSWIYTSSGTWLCPAGVTSVLVQCWGAGGGGGGGNGQVGGGGGGGAYAEKIVSVTPGNSYTVNVGAAGSGNGVSSNTGSDGGDSYFNDSSTVMAKGGLGGKNDAAFCKGGLASASVGTTKYSGGNGTQGDNGGGGGGAGTSANGGNASGSTGGTGGTGNPNGLGGTGGAAGFDGTNGTAIGGGGGGGQSGAGAGASSGARGEVRITPQ